MRFAYLDGIRGIAALFVVARHWNALLGFDFHFTYLAVDIFFLLSGFVIAHAYDEKLRSGKLSAGAFMSIRFVRLYPVYVLAVGVSLAVQLWHPSASGASSVEWTVSALLALFFLPSIVTGSALLFPLNLCFWSLFDELALNALYGYARRLLSNAVLLVLIGTSACLLALIAVKSGDIDHGYGFTATSIVAGLVRALFGMALGFMMYRHRARLAAVGSRVSPWVGVLIVVGVMAAPPIPGMNAIMDLLAIFVLFPVGIMIAASREPPYGWELRSMVILGISSYPLYLLHIPVGHIVEAYAGASPESARPLALAAMVISFVLCVQLERHVDVPARQWLRTRLQRRAAALGA